MQTATIRPINSIAPKTGGAMSFLSSYMNWKVIAIIVVSLLLIIFAYYMFKSYTNNKTAFHANRENIPKDETATKNATIMLFYADWCPYCKTAKPEWDSIKSDYDGKSINGYNVQFVEYNCTNETAEISQLIEKYSIDGFPTIKLLKDNQVVEYDAKPTKSTIDQFLHTVL